MPKLRTLLVGDQGDVAFQTVSTAVKHVPEPVLRYFAFALPVASQRIVRGHIDWSGKMRLEREGRAIPFTARQTFTAAPPEFEWNAKLAVFPCISVRVRDAYENGHGSTRAQFAHIVPIMNERGTPQTAEAALQRFLGESIWFPTSLLPSAGVVWKEVDAHCATATLTDHGNEASVDFHFSDRGEVVACSALRYRNIGSRSVLTLWHTRMWDYHRVNGMMIPRSAYAQWFLPEGPLTYWQGTVRRVRYEHGL